MNGPGAAISPNIFDAFTDTRFLLPLVLGNLLSQKLWDLSARIQTKISTDESQTNGIDDPLRFIRAIQKQLDRKFKHLHSNEVAEIYGELSLAQERQRLGNASVDEALEAIEANFLQRINEGSLPPEALEPLLARIKEGYFPAFFYGNIDIVMANKALLGRKSSAPLGITSCLDEVAIFASLAMTMPGGSVASVIALTSASHYTAFGWTPSGEAWWLYGKNRLYTRQDWSDLVTQQFNGNAQKAFDYYLKDLSRIVCVTGTLELTSGRTAISTEILNVILDHLDYFFGVRLTQITAGLLLSPKIEEPSPFAPVLRALLGSQSLEWTRNYLLTQQDPRLLEILYSHRSLALQDLFPYLSVARHQPICKALGRALTTRQEAIDIVKKIVGSDSIFNDRNRIAMPDETLRLKTGSDRDKALLLHTLLEHLHASTSLSQQVVTLLTTKDSFVCVEGFCFSLNALSPVDRPTEDILALLSDDV